MKLKLAVALAALSVGFAGIAVGQDDPIAARQALMKANGGAMKAASDMVKGTTPYDAAAAAAAMKTVQDDMVKFAALFPEGSDQGDTKASPAIWSDNAGFMAAVDKIVADAKAAETAAAQGIEAFGPALQAVGANCSGCHKAYRE